MAGGIATANSGGGSIAQNWLDRAERAPSSFDPASSVAGTGAVHYGVGVRGGALLGGWKGLLFKVDDRLAVECG
jgi:hypothetical protein